jgi:putative lipoic acid-binding regulatory protein
MTQRPIDMTQEANPASLIEYPCHFPIKVMGAAVAGFLEAMVQVVLQFDPAFDRQTIEQRPSKGGNYLGLTLSVHVTHREQLDELYRTLSTHPMVKVVL